ncbi:MAG: ANTAR domain-containing protein [Amphritea sp.]
MKPAHTTTERVLVIDNDTARSTLLEEALKNQGYDVVCRLNDTEGLISKVEQVKPDIIVVKLDCPDTDMLEHMSTLNQHSPRPVVMFAEKGDNDTIEQAIKSGVSAYVVDGMSADRLQPIMNVAAIRFRENQALKSELTDMQTQLADRKLIEQAKGLVMKYQKCSEDQAFTAMRKMAMDKGQSLGTVAKDLITALSG